MIGTKLQEEEKEDKIYQKRVNSNKVLNLEHEQFKQHLYNTRHIFDESTRNQLHEIVFEGIPSHLRGFFWKKCSGLEAYKQNYCAEYYQTLQNAD